MTYHKATTMTVARNVRDALKDYVDQHDQASLSDGLADLLRKQGYKFPEGQGR